MTNEIRRSYKGMIIRTTAHHYFYVLAYGYDNQFKTLKLAKAFIDRFIADKENRNE